MKKNTLTTLGIMVLSITMLASTVTGCGSKETSEVQATEVVEAVMETEAVVPETEVVEEATEEIVVEDTETTEVEETEAQEGADYTVKDMSATKYAKQKVNVRSGASTDYEQIGSLNANQKVTVTGQADTGWYRIDYNGKEGYVSDKYLSDQKVTASTSGSNTNTTTNAGNTNNASGNNSNSGNTASTSAPSSNNDSNGSAGNTYTPSGDTGNTSTPSTDTGSSTGGGDVSTPSTDTPSTPEDDPNCIGSVGGNWQGPIDDSNGGTITEWE